jgi:hypothetical protein
VTDLQTAMASGPAYAEFSSLCDEDVEPAAPQSVPSTGEAREVQLRVEALAAEVEQTEQHLRKFAAQEEVIPGADIDGALRMRRGAVTRRMGKLRKVAPRTAVVSPTPEELAHLHLGDEPDGR